MAVEDNSPPPYQMTLLELETRALVGGHVEDSDYERSDECEVCVGLLFKRPKWGICKMCM